MSDLNLLNYSESDVDNIDFIMKWANRMNKIHGPYVKDEDGNEYDWGQGLCREQYGEDWNVYMVENDIRIPDDTSIKIAKIWEKGEFPDWIVFSEESVDKYNEYKFEF